MSVAVLSAQEAAHAGSTLGGELAVEDDDGTLAGGAGVKLSHAARGEEVLLDGVSGPQVESPTDVATLVLVRVARVHDDGPFYCVVKLAIEKCCHL